MARGYGFRHRTTYCRTLLGMICGITFGLFTGLYNQDSVSECRAMEDYGVQSNNRPAAGMKSLASWSQMFNSDPILPQANLNQPAAIGPEFVHMNYNQKPRSKLVLIGVMTAAKYLRTRAVASIQTWARNIPGKVMYFSSEGSEKLVPPGFPVVGLKGVDDTYPPQKKSFLMLKYMYEYYGDEYEWFMRVDDDIFVKGDTLELFLRSIDSTIPQFIGQAGLGNQVEFGMLNLDKKENYCMGGPGMVFSSSTLQKMVPNISYCLKNLYTTHEDVEVGRCVSKFAQASCTWAYEMQHLFYHNHKDPNGSFAASLHTDDIDHALTLHPVKNHTYQYRIQTHFLSQESRSLRHKTLLLQRAVHDMDVLLQDRDQFYSPNRLGLNPSLVKFVPKTREEVLSWDFITKSVFSYKNLNPKIGLDLSQKYALDNVVRQVMTNINQNARQRGRTIDFKDLLYGYKRVDPLHGANYVLDLLLVYRKHKGRKMTIPVRRHAYLQQAFSAIEFREDPQTEDLSVLDNARRSYINDATPTSLVNVIQSHLSMFSLYGSNSNDKQQGENPHGGQLFPENYAQINFKEKVLYLILTVSGRFEKFQSFMDNLENVVFKREKQAVLSVMIFHHETEDRTADMLDLVVKMQRRYPQHSIQGVEVDGPFSRGLGLEKGSLLHPPDALLVFIDVDMYFHEDSLTRIKLNTIQGKQVYFPAVFSQFDPSVYCNATCRENNMYPTPFHYSDVAGYWRLFGFGIASMYNSDFQSVGGFDKEIEGWGSEDVKLYETFIKRNYSIFRAAEMGLVHIFHPIFCDPSLESSQYRMCLGSKAATFASILKLSDMVYSDKTILHRNEAIVADSIVDEKKQYPSDIKLAPNKQRIANNQNALLVEKNSIKDNSMRNKREVSKSRRPMQGENGQIPQIRRPGS